MQSSVDFVAALTSEPPLDFVTALSAEQGCDVCHELHAAVDELRCHECEAAICPDCARLRPDAQWACLLCDENHPMRVYKARGGRGGPRSGLRAQMRVRALVAGEAALVASEALRGALATHSPRVRVALARVSPRVRAALAKAAPLARRTLLRARGGMELGLTRTRADWAALVLWLAGATSAARQRGAVGLQATSKLSLTGLELLGRMGIALWAWSLRAAGSLSSRARSGGAQLRQHSLVLRERGVQGSLVVRRIRAEAAERARTNLMHAWITLRNLPVRHHATGLLVAGVILFLVARADHREG